MEMPFLNIINKINLLGNLPKLKFRLNDFLTADGLSYILQAEELTEKQKFSDGTSDEYEQINKGFFLKYKGLNAGRDIIITFYHFCINIAFKRPFIK